MASSSAIRQLKNLKKAIWKLLSQPAVMPSSWLKAKQIRFRRRSCWKLSSLAKEAMLPLIEAQEELQKNAGVAKREVVAPVVDEVLIGKVRNWPMAVLAKRSRSSPSRNGTMQIDAD